LKTTTTKHTIKFFFPHFVVVAVMTPSLGATQFFIKQTFWQFGDLIFFFVFVTSWNQ